MAAADPNTGREDTGAGKGPGREADPQVIVPIHGTGAASDADEGDRWWQRGSPFACGLDNHTVPQAKCLEKQEPFHWSGKNSERDRRFYGKRLYERYIRPLEEQCRPYHLVAHSHGGGVIVEALIEAARHNQHLQYLRSWSTVGTPFLSYKPRARHWTALLPVFAVLISLIWLAPLGTEYVSHRSELIRSRNLPAVILPPVLIGLPLAMAAMVAASWVLSLIRRARSIRYAALRRRVVSELGDRWLGIASSADEAVNGLRSTLTLRSNVAWRLPPLGNLRPFFRIVLVPLQPFTWFYNTCIAAAADEFIWSLTTRRLQGADLQGQILTTVSEDLEPPSLRTAPLPVELDAEIIAHANADSAGTLAGVRSVLGLASQSSDSGHTLLAGFTKALTWQELVHTSYMRYPAVVELLARHIIEHARPGSTAAVAPMFVLPADSAVAPPLPKLSTVINLSLVVAAALAVVLGTVVTRALVGPYTDQYQVDAIWSQLKDPEIQNPHGASIGLASVLAAHALIVRDGADEQFASTIRSPHTKHLAMEWVAGADALAGNPKMALELIRNIDDPNAASRAAAVLFNQLSSTGNYAAANLFFLDAGHGAARPDDFGLKLLVAGGLKACNHRDAAIELVRKAVVVATAKPWDVDAVIAGVAQLKEESETTDAINQVFKTPAEKAHGFICAATIFMNQGNRDAAARLVAKFAPEDVNPTDTDAALILYAHLDNVAAIGGILSRSFVSCHELAQVGEVFLRGKATDRVRDIEALMIANARAVPMRPRIAECLLDVSLLQSSSGDNAKASETFSAAVKLIGEIPNDEGFRANLSGLAAEVALRRPLNRALASEWLGKAESDAGKLPPTPAFALLIRLADMAIMAGEKDELRTILRTAGEAIARDTEYQSRAPKYRRLAERYAAAGWYREARLVAERSVIGDERLRAFAVIVWHIRGRDTPQLRRLLAVTKNEQGDVVLAEMDPNEQKRADDDDTRRMMRIGLGPVCPSECTAVHRP